MRFSSSRLNCGNLDRIKNKLVRWRNGRRKNRISKVETPLQFTGSNPVLTTKKNKVMKEALKIIFLFKKPTHDDFRLPYTIFGIIGWLEVVSILIALIK